MNCDFEPPPHSRKRKEPNWREGALVCCWDPESKPLGSSAYPLKADTSQISESYPLQVREAWAKSSEVDPMWKGAVSEGREAPRTRLWPSSRPACWTVSGRQTYL